MVKKITSSGIIPSESIEDFLKRSDVSKYSLEELKVLLENIGFSEETVREALKNRINNDGRGNKD